MAKQFFLVCAGLFMLAAAYHLGTPNAGAASAVAAPMEVATLSGVAPDGGTIPLPAYADGTTALESERKWTVGLHHLGYGGPQPGAGSLGQVFCNSDGRVVRAWGYAYNAGWEVTTGDANYLIVATRGASAPTPASAQSLGALKAKYR